MINFNKPVRNHLSYYQFSIIMRPQKGHFSIAEHTRICDQISLFSFLDLNRRIPRFERLQGFVQLSPFLLQPLTYGFTRP